VANLTTYKPIKIGSNLKGSLGSVVKQRSLAINRLGSTLNSISTLARDIEQISINKIKEQGVREKLERRKKRRELDQKFEDKTEQKKPKVGTKVKGALRKGGKKALGFMEKFLGPIGNLLFNIAKFAITREILKWISNPENTKKLETFIDKAKFVFQKLFDFAAFLTTNLLDGLGNLFGEDSTFLDRLKGIGQIFLGIIGLRYLMNPFKIITDILNLLDLLGDGGGRPDLDGPDGGRRRGPDVDVDGRQRRTGARDRYERRYGKDAADKRFGKKPRGKTPRNKRRRGLGGLMGLGCPNPLDFLPDSTPKNVVDDVAKATDKLDDAADAAKKIDQAGDIADAAGDAAKKKNIFQKGGDFLGNWWKTSGSKTLTNTVDAAKNLGSSLLKQIDALPSPLKLADDAFKGMTALGQKAWKGAVSAGKAIGSTAQKWGTGIGNFAAKSLDDIKGAGKAFLQNKIINVIQPIIQPLVEKFKSIGDKAMGLIQKIPGYDKVAKLFKSKGISSIADAGPKLGKRAGAVLPVIGGIVNLAFAYDRFASGDSFGGLLETISAILDFGGLATAGASNVASMFLDGYLFARDFIPQLAEGEDAVFQAIGLGDAKKTIDDVFSKLPNLGELLGKFVKMMGLGGGGEEEKMFGGVVKKIGGALGGITSNPIAQVAASAIPGAGAVMAGANMVSNIAQGNFDPTSMLTSAFSALPGVEGAKFIDGNTGEMLGMGAAGLQSALGGNNASTVDMMSDFASKFGLGGMMKAATGAQGASVESGMTELASNLGVKPEVISGAKKGAELAQGGMSGQYAMEQALQFVQVPVIIEKLMPMPMAVPINTGGPAPVRGGPSTLTKKLAR
jgi:hypothetical protein